MCTIFTTEAIAVCKKVAVYVEGEISRSDKDIVSSAALARLYGNKDFIPFERNSTFIKALDKEQDYQVSGEVSEKEIRKTGERMGVDYLIVINVTIFSDDQCHMSARLVNLTSGEILKSVNIIRDYKGVEVLSAMANNVTYRLINR